MYFYLCYYTAKIRKIFEICKFLAKNLAETYIFIIFALYLTIYAYIYISIYLYKGIKRGSYTTGINIKVIVI